MSEVPPEREFEVVVKPSFLVTVSALLLSYALLYSLVTWIGGQPAQFAETLNWATGVVILIMLGTMLHELGHVVAGLAVGHRWTKLVLDGAGIGVGMSPAPHGWHRITRSLAGPLVQLLVSVPLLAVVYVEWAAGVPVLTPQHSMWWVGGMSNLVLAVICLLPVPAWDGGKAISGVRDLRRQAQS
ncbi:MAG: M50 family metallopeptidase [Gammaproteobacteria bacterium]|nr:M50 family metallopeptidase [Gammaproteobacteria bacterium]